MRIASSPSGRQTFGHHNVAIHGITGRMVDNAEGSGLVLPAWPPGCLHRGPSLVVGNVVAERPMIRAL